ncbi:outer membrane lipoprotein carrier protein LolA [Rhodobacterales bacterium HKCCSP123]|nr:outer membrane lipoprotein carrier protein LolA [Rhodobacterales bacterium HKCCSP123]
MKRFALSFALLVALAAPALADRVPLSQLSRYLEGITTAEGTFTQINSDGTISTGDIYIQRPGRIRFEYDAEDLLVMAGGGQVAIFDGRSNSRGEQYPLAETPLNLILSRDVDLARSGMVIGHEFDGTATRVLAQDPDRPEVGTIELVFTGDPVELRQWIITDSTGAQTTVVLGNLREGGQIPSRLFSIPLEIRSRNPGD